MVCRRAHVVVLRPSFFPPSSVVQSRVRATILTRRFSGSLGCVSHVARSPLAGCACSKHDDARSSLRILPTPTSSSRCLHMGNADDVTPRVSALLRGAPDEPGTRTRTRPRGCCTDQSDGQRFSSRGGCARAPEPPRKGRRIPIEVDRAIDARAPQGPRRGRARSLPTAPSPALPRLLIA